MKNIIIVLMLIFVGLISQAQDQADYYKIPSQRKTTAEIKSLPNLKLIESNLYLGIGGGLFKNGSIINNSERFPISSMANIQTYYNLNIGLNKAKNYFEIEYQNLPFFFKTQFQNIEYGPSNLKVVSEPKMYTVGIKAKRRMFLFDKITETTSFNLGLGLDLAINKNPFDANETLNFKIKENPEQLDIKTLNLNIKNQKQKIGLELLAEIRGKIIPKFEIAVFGKIIFMPNSMTKHSFKANLIDGSFEQFGNKNKQYFILTGLQVMFNAIQKKNFSVL